MGRARRAPAPNRGVRETLTYPDAQAPEFEDKAVDDVTGDGKFTQLRLWGFPMHGVNCGVPDAARRRGRGGGPSSYEGGAKDKLVAAVRSGNALMIPRTLRAIGARRTVSV